MIHPSRNQERNWLSCAIALCLLSAGHVLLAAEARSFVGNDIRPFAGKSWSSGQQTFQPSQQASAASDAHSSVSLAPAIVMVRCKSGQSYTQVLTLFNQTQQDVVSEMAAEDVVVRDGARVFVPAGDTAGSIAATAVFSQRQVAVKPGQSASVGVTLTVPPETPLRAAVVLFRGMNKASGSSSVTMTASLGALFTFTVSENIQIEGSPITVNPQSTTANLGVSQVLTNTGSEPVIAGGIAAVLNETGALVGKAVFEEQRLLPGEQLLFKTEYPAELKTGSYRVIASFQYEDKVITNSADFAVP